MQPHTLPASIPLDAQKQQRRYQISEPYSLALTIVMPALGQYLSRRNSGSGFAANARPEVVCPFDRQARSCQQRLPATRTVIPKSLLSQKKV
jgi:hypothetical protein